MIIKASDRNINEEQAINTSMKSLFKKTILPSFDKKEILPVSIGNVKLVYFPYWISLTANRFDSKLLGEKNFNIIAAVEGWNGETGISVGTPEAKDMEVEENSVVPLRIDRETASKKVVDCVTRNVMVKNRHIPEVEIIIMDVIRKPTFIVPLSVLKKGKINRLFRFVDAESGYIIYRYDLEICKLKDKVPVLSSL